MKSTSTRIPPKIMAALRMFYEDVDAHEALQSITEVMRMIGQSDMMAESDPDAEKFWVLLYYLIVLLKEIQNHRLYSDAEKINELANQITRLKRKGKKRQPGQAMSTKGPSVSSLTPPNH